MIKKFSQKIVGHTITSRLYEVQKKNRGINVDCTMVQNLNKRIIFYNTAAGHENQACKSTIRKVKKNQKENKDIARKSPKLELSINFQVTKD